MGFLQGEGIDKEMKTASRIPWKDYYSKDLEPGGLGRILALTFIKCVTFDKATQPLFTHFLICMMEIIIVSAPLLNFWAY